MEEPASEIVKAKEGIRAGMDRYYNRAVDKLTTQNEGNEPSQSQIRNLLELEMVTKANALKLAADQTEVRTSFEEMMTRITLSDNAETANRAGSVWALGRNEFGITDMGEYQTKFSSFQEKLVSEGGILPFQQ